MAVSHRDAITFGRCMRSHPFQKQLPNNEFFPTSLTEFYSIFNTIATRFTNSLVSDTRIFGLFGKQYRQSASVTDLCLPCSWWKAPHDPV